MSPVIKSAKKMSGPQGNLWSIKKQTISWFFPQFLKIVKNLKIVHNGRVAKRV